MDKNYHQQIAVITSDETMGLYEEIIESVNEYNLPPSTTLGILEIVKASIINGELKRP